MRRTPPDMLRLRALLPRHVMKKMCAERRNRTHKRCRMAHVWKDYATHSMRPQDDELTGAQTHTSSARERPHVVAMWPGGSVAKELPSSATLTVGRATRCDVVIDHPSVSREHAVFHGGPAIAIEDLGSTNGTTVGGARVSKGARVPIERGQIIAIGEAVLVVRGMPL